MKPKKKVKKARRVMRARYHQDQIFKTVESAVLDAAHVGQPVGSGELRVLHFADDSILEIILVSRRHRTSKAWVKALKAECKE